MRPGATRATLYAAVVAIVMAPGLAGAQTGSYERSFHQPKAVVEQLLKQLQASMSGRLPVLEGFTAAGEHPLDRFRRGYFQSTVQVSEAASGGCVVRVSAKITAWYSDPVPSRSGYRLLASNGRLENDLLDQLSEQLIGLPGPAAAARPKQQPAKPVTKPLISAPMPQPGTGRDLSSPMHIGVSQRELAESNAAPSHPSQGSKELEAEAASLEEVLKNQAHPRNMIAVKKSGTPVVSAPSLTGKAMFMASMHDEFEMLDFNRDWVHVRISGLSRGWIWRDSVEMPDNIPDNPQTSMGPPPAADLFQVTREETAPFPGDWEPLRGKSVKIVSVQKIHESSKDGDPRAKLEFAKFLLDKNYAELTRESKDVSGIVLIFDSVDGGMIAATLASLARWKAGALSDAALWHQCFFDPPETFSVAGASGSF